jgi:hypothetical protein
MRKMKLVSEGNRDMVMSHETCSNNIFLIFLK